MLKKHRMKIAYLGLLVIVLLACGLIGYFNDSGRGSIPVTHLGWEATATLVRSAGDLDYCGEENKHLCIVSIGADSSKNALIVIKNPDSTITALHISTKAGRTTRQYACRAVQRLDDTFYCTGEQIQDGNLDVTIYSTKDERALARGLFVFTGGVGQKVTSTPTLVPPTRTPRPNLTMRSSPVIPTLTLPAGTRLTATRTPTPTGSPAYSYP